jgi:hypothetical protein
MVSKTVLAERILMSAANGERDRKRLFAAALSLLTDRQTHTA